MSDDEDIPGDDSIALIDGDDTPYDGRAGDFDDTVEGAADDAPIPSAYSSELEHWKDKG